VPFLAVVNRGRRVSPALRRFFHGESRMDWPFSSRKRQFGWNVTHAKDVRDLFLASQIFQF
jgi:hypothetical protein